MKPVQFVFAAFVAGYLVVRRRELSRLAKALLVLLVAALVAYGAGAFELPDFEHIIRDLGTSLGKWTYLLVGAMAFAETGAFLGFIAPGEVTVIVGGVVAGQGKIDVVALIAVVWVAAVAGDMTSYYLGRRLGREFLVRHGARVKITSDRLAQVESFFARRGGMTILVGRFIGFVRPIAPFLAGSSKMPFRRFVPYDVLAAGLWSTTFVLLGYVFWQSFDKVAAIARQGALALGLVVALVVGIVVLVRRREELRRRALETRAGRALAGPAGFVWNRLTPGNLGLELTTLLAVAAVGSFAFFGELIAVEHHFLAPGDRAAMHLMAHLRSGGGVHVARVLTWLGSGPVVWVVVLVVVAVLARRRRMVEAVVLLVGMILSTLLVHLTKGAVDRPRPLHPLVGTRDASFPSGHAANATALVAVAVAIARAAPFARAAVLVSAAVALLVVVGLTRIYLRAHYLSDVLAGAGLAAAVFALCGTVGLIVNFMRNNGER